VKLAFTHQQGSWGWPVALAISIAHGLGMPQSGQWFGFKVNGDIKALRKIHCQHHHKNIHALTRALAGVMQTILR